MTEWLLLLAAVLLTAATGFFVAAEFSLTTVDRGRAEEAAEAGDAGARGVVAALRGLSTQLSAAQLGITITTLVVGFLAEPALGELLHGPLEALGLSAGAVTRGVLRARDRPRDHPADAARRAGPQEPRDRQPAARSPPSSPRGCGRSRRRPGGSCTACSGWPTPSCARLGFEPKEELDSARGADELAAVARRSAAEGDLSPVAARLLTRSLDLRQKYATDVMTPRTRLWTVGADATATDVIRAATESGNSRFPVYGADLDEVTGIVHVKHAVAVPEDERDRRTAGELAAPLLAVPSSLQLERLLDLLREQGLQVALVVDEWGATHGLVTLEDIVEELVGEITDETDRPLRTLRRVDEDAWLLSGLLRPGRGARPHRDRASPRAATRPSPASSPSGCSGCPTSATR